VSNKWIAESFVLTPGRPKIEVFLPAGYRFVILVRGQKPSLAPVQGPQSMTIQGFPRMGDATKPAVFCKVPERHVDAWLALKDQQIADIVDSILRAELVATVVSHSTLQ